MKGWRRKNCSPCLLFAITRFRGGKIWIGIDLVSVKSDFFSSKRKKKAKKGKIKKWSKNMYRLFLFSACSVFQFYLFCFFFLLVLIIFCFYFCLFYFPSTLSPVIILPPTSTVPQASPVLDLALYRCTHTHTRARTHTHTLKHTCIMIN